MTFSQERGGRVLQVEGTGINKIMGVKWQYRRPTKIRNKTEEVGVSAEKAWARGRGATEIFSGRTTGSYVL